MEWKGDDIDEEHIVEPTEGPELVEGEEAGEERAEGKVAKMYGEIERLRKEKQEYLDGWQRAKADYVNAVKRFEGDKGRERERGVVKAVDALLPALDALERAKEHGEIPVGFEQIVKQLEAAFAGLGVTAVGEVGEPFDPALHEALGQDHTESLEQDETISAILEKGWKLGDALARPAKVRIFRA